jgi:hypothetical protein
VIKNVYSVFLFLVLPGLIQAAPTVSECSGSSSTAYEVVWAVKTHLWTLHDYVDCDYYRFAGTASFNINQLPIMYCKEDVTPHSCCTGDPSLCGLTQTKCNGEVMVSDCHYTADIKPSFLIVGENKLDFSTTYILGAVYSYMDAEQILTLFGPSKFEKELYRQTWVQPQSVSVSFTLTWDDINIELGRKIKDLLAKLESIHATLWKAAFDSYFTLNQLCRLEGLTAKLNEWLDKGLDQLNSGNLADTLKDYGDFGEAQAEIDALLTMLNKNLTQLKQDLEGLTTQFSARTNNIVSGVVSAATNYGYDPIASNNYIQESTINDQADITIPEISPEAPLPFDLGNNQYDLDATNCIAQLNNLTNGGTVTDRAGFIRIVLLWKDTQEAIRFSLHERATASANEYAAFLNAQQRVITFLSSYLDENMWYRDTPIPIAIRQIIDNWGWGVDENMQPWPYFVNARYLKYAFEEWYGTLSPEQMLFLNLLPGTQDYVQAVAYMIKSADQEELSEVLPASDDLMESLAYAGARIGTGFIPIVGTFLDFCEMVSGYEYCTPSGRELSTFERSMSGFGVVIGNGALWRTLNATSKTTLKAVSYEANFTISAFVKAGKKLPLMRRDYEMTVRSFSAQIAPLKLAGNTSEQIARILHEQRRALGSAFKNMTPLELREQIFARNLRQYGDELGPTIDFLRAQGKSWDAIIESACRPGKFPF